MIARSTFALFLTITLLSPTFSGEVSTQILVDNFGPGDSFDTSFGYVLGGTQNIEQGTSFTVTGGIFALDYVDAAIGHFSGFSNAGELAVYSAVDGSPGVMLESVTLSGFPDFGGSFAPSRFEFSGDTILHEGETYFIIGNALEKSLLGTETTLLWGWNSTGDNRENWIRSNGGPWQQSSNSVAPALRVVGTEIIPEPSTWILLSAMAGILSWRRQRNKVL